MIRTLIFVAAILSSSAASAHPTCAQLWDKAAPSPASSKALDDVLLTGLAYAPYNAEAFRRDAVVDARTNVTLVEQLRTFKAPELAEELLEQLASREAFIGLCRLADGYLNPTPFKSAAAYLKSFVR